MEKFKNTKPLRLIELFAGIGSQAKALKNLNIPFESHFVCDFDKYAIKSYNAIHNTNYEPCDITKVTASDLNIVDTDLYTYLLTYSFPCQDLSVAGKGAGMEKGSGTRSGLLWEVERLLNECTELPQLLLMENVTQVHGKKNIDHFIQWIEFLESKGYSNHWQDLNSKNFGIPQNRNRCFMVSILGEYSFTFPKEFPLRLRLADMLEDEVAEKFYISDAYIKYAEESTSEQADSGNGFKFEPMERERVNVAKSVTSKAGQRMTDNFIREREGVIVRDKGRTVRKTTDVCSTLMARDYKGLPNFDHAAVIEYKSNNR